FIEFGDEFLLAFIACCVFSTKNAILHESEFFIYLSEHYHSVFENTIKSRDNVILRSAAFRSKPHILKILRSHWGLTSYDAQAQKNYALRVNILKKHKP